MTSLKRRNPKTLQEPDNLVKDETCVYESKDFSPNGFVVTSESLLGPLAIVASSLAMFRSVEDAH
jgi:hypothetical protein